MFIKNKRCVNCSQYKSCKNSAVSWIFFIIGIIATISMRLVGIAMNKSPFYGKLFWYIGMLGFFVFFLYRYKTINQRAKTINELDLVGKIENKRQFDDKDYSVMADMLCAQKSFRERGNFIVIFALSALALIIAAYIDFFS